MLPTAAVTAAETEPEHSDPTSPMWISINMKVIINVSETSGVNNPDFLYWYWSTVTHCCHRWAHNSISHLLVNSWQHEVFIIEQIHSFYLIALECCPRLISTMYLRIWREGLLDGLIFVCLLHKCTDLKHSLWQQTLTWKLRLHADISKQCKVDIKVVSSLQPNMPHSKQCWLKHRPVIHQ